MKKEKYFCDFCKKELTKKNQPKRQPKLPMWVTTIANFLNGEEETFENFGVDMCSDCYNSYQNWKKSRKVRK